MKRETISDLLVKELKSLKDKADLLASIHSRLSDEYGRAHTWISSMLLAISTMLVGLTFISEDFVYSSVVFECVEMDHWNCLDSEFCWGLTSCRMEVSG